ncbi:nucleotidyltransferase family protein [Photobacterium sp. SDRW27]|uniref:nucleotidyltransferase family protein n=1 Tax=Photobacterium obscurum TaxID=2829490 RepID=UPI0022446B25|nr:nucleotidyltransferase family protein [Photobacterium obscurum]MCW8329333.1 nucleotidyltransferase family protein [Photobacterium obscurum]
MNYQYKTAELLQADAFRMECLRIARTVNLPDWYLGAGFLRNAIWDHLHNKMQMTPLNDLDLVYYDPDDLSSQTERQIEAQLTQLYPAVVWEVRNQARMHVRHGHQPYASTAEGIAQWVEVPTCVGVRLEANDELTFTAPFGLEENWSLSVQVNPINSRPEIFKQRIEAKKWRQIWPNLVFDKGNSV